MCFQLGGVLPDVKLATLDPVVPVKVAPLNPVVPVKCAAVAIHWDRGVFTDDELGYLD